MAQGKKKTIQEHQKDGTFRPSVHLPDFVPSGNHSKLVELCPEHIPEEVKSYWYLIVGQMTADKTLNDGDRALIESYVMAIHLRNECFKDIVENGIQIKLHNSKGAEYVSRNPALESLDAIEKRIILICKQLGLSPLARTDIGVSASDRKDPLRGEL